MAKKEKNKRLLNASAYALLQDAEKRRAIKLSGGYYVLYPKELQPAQLKVIKNERDYNETTAKTKRNEAKNSLVEEVTINDFKKTNQMLGQFIMNGSSLLEKDWRLFKKASPEMDWVKKSLAALNNTLGEGLAEYINKNGVFDEKAYLEKINTAFEEFIAAAQNYADSRSPSSWAGKRRRRRVVDLLNNAKKMKGSLKTMVDSVKQGSIEFEKMDAQTKTGLTSWNLINQVNYQETTEIEWQNQGNSTDVYRIKLKGEDNKEYYLKENLPFLNENMQGFLTRRIKQLDISKNNRGANGDKRLVEQRLLKISDKDYNNCKTLLENLSNALKNTEEEGKQALSDKFAAYFAHNFDNIFAEREIYNDLVGTVDENDLDQLIENSKNDMEKEALRVRKQVLEDRGINTAGSAIPEKELSAAQWIKIKLKLDDNKDKLFYDSIKNLTDDEIETLFRVTLGKEVELFGQMSANKMQSGEDKAAINNTATSRVAEHLGFDDVITKSKTMLVKFPRRDGSEVTQLCTVCEAAPGLELIDLMKMAEKSGKKIVFSPEANRQRLRLQAIDTLTLQKDRHGRNLKCLHEIDPETGNIIIKTIKAYDNDMSFDAVSLLEAFDEASGEPKRNQFLPAMNTVVKKDSALYKYVLGSYFGVDTLSMPAKAEVPVVKLGGGTNMYVNLKERGGLSFGPKLVWNGENAIQYAGTINTVFRSYDNQLIINKVSPEEIQKMREEAKNFQYFPKDHSFEDEADKDKAFLIEYSKYKFVELSEKIREIWLRPAAERKEMEKKAKAEKKSTNDARIFYRTDLSDEQIIKLDGLIKEIEELEKKFDFSGVCNSMAVPLIDCFNKSVKYMYYTVYGDTIDYRMMTQAKDYDAIKSLMNKNGDLEIPSLLHYDHEAFKSLQKSVADYKNPDSLAVHKLKELGLSDEKINALAQRNEEMLEKIKDASQKAEIFYKAAGWKTSPKNKFFLDKEDYKDLDNLSDYAINPANTYLAIDNDNYLAGQKFMMNVKGKQTMVSYEQLMNGQEKLKAENYNDYIMNDEKRWKYEDNEKVNKKAYESNTANQSSVSTNAVRYMKCSLDDAIYAISHNEIKDKQQLSEKFWEVLYNKRILSEMSKAKQPYNVDKIRERMKPDSQMRTAYKAEFNTEEGRLFNQQMERLAEEVFREGNHKKMTGEVFEKVVDKAFKRSIKSIFKGINDQNVVDKNAKIEGIAKAATKMKDIAKLHGVAINQEEILNKFISKNPNAFTAEQANKLKEAMKPAAEKAPGKQNIINAVPKK